MENGEIVVYQPDEITRLEVRVDKETVWLNRHQLAALSVVANFATTASDGKTYSVEHYNLDMILSVGFRVKSQRGIQFRRWANTILKEYLLKGYSMNSRLTAIEHRLDEHQKQLDFFIRTSLPPMEGVFYGGQIFDAYAFVSELIRSARKRLVLIDNYVDESVLTMLSKRESGVTAEIRTWRISEQLRLDIEKHNAQYQAIDIFQIRNIHDRFLIVDDTVYHIGASLKDLGKKLFAFSKMGVSPEALL